MIVGHIQGRKNKIAMVARTKSPLHAFSFACSSWVQPKRVERSVSAESGEKVGLGARRGTHRARHAATSPATAHGETGQDEEDHGSKGEPEALTTCASAACCES